MGYSFSTIVIKYRENKNGGLEKLLSIIGENYREEKMKVKFSKAMEEVQLRNSESFIVIYANEQVIKVEDLTDTIRPEELQRISEELSTEVLRATNADTAGISSVLLFENGEHIREKTLREEWESLEQLQRFFPDATEKDMKPLEVGEKTKYESNGSNAISVIREFEKGLIEYEEYENMLASIYKFKGR